MIDQLINQAIVGIRTPFLNKFMLLITLTGNWQMVVLGILLLSILLIILQKKDYFIALLLSNVSALFFILVIKNLIGRIRPPIENALIIEKGFALPSGHSYFAVVFYGFIIYLLFHHIRSPWLKIILSTLGSTYTLLLAFSRIYLGVHWFTDVIVGLLFGIIWLTIIVMYLKNKPKTVKKIKPLVNKKITQAFIYFFITFWLLELFWFYKNNVNNLGTKIINPISAATTETTNTAPAAKSRAKVVSEY
jgi:undecaprenyl-diphosphatase